MWRHWRKGLSQSLLYLMLKRGYPLWRYNRVIPLTIFTPFNFDNGVTPVWTVDPDTCLRNDAQGFHSPDEGFADHIEAFRLFRDPPWVNGPTGVDPALADVDPRHGQGEGDVLAVAVRLCVKAEDWRRALCKELIHF